jgi:transcriptional regulator with XRE-family HTH domain
MPGAPSLPLALRWLITDRGLTEHELAVRAGVSPGAVTAFLSRPHAPSGTWLHLLGALHATLAVQAPGRFLTIPLPKPSPHRRAHERRQWQARRLAAFRAQVHRQRPELPAETVARTAAAYVAASAARLDASLAAAEARLAATRLDTSANGLRAAARALATAAAINAEEWALLAGVSFSTTRAALGDGDDGRLATPHRLFSAIAVRLVVHAPGGGSVAIDLAPPGAWRPEAPRPGRSAIDHVEIRRRADSGEPLAGIARAAGVSRQRIHAIVRG